MDRCQLWKAESAWPHCLILGGETLVAGGRDEVAALRAADGSIAWRHKVTGRAYGLATASGSVFVSTDEGTIHCLRSAASQASITPTTSNPGSTR